MKVHGQCLCGAITYEAEAEPAKTSICHCTDCQVLTGTAFRTSVPVAGEAFKLLSGKPTEYVKIAESGTPRAQAFCGSCGTPLYGTAPLPGPRHIYMLRVGAFRERDQFVPTRQIWAHSAQPWSQSGLAGLPTSPKEPGS